MKSFHLTVSSPDGNVYDGECIKLDVRGVEGDLAVMAGHTPFVTAVCKGRITLLTDEETERIAESEGGLLSVAKDKVTLLSGTFKFID